VNSAIPVILVLALVGSSLVCAALYALFGKPSTAQGEKRKKEVISGFQLTGGILFGFVLMGSLVFGAAFAFGQIPDSRVSRPLAAMFAGVAFFLIALLVQRWAKYFAGWIVWGVINSLTVLGTGHALNNPTVPVNRPYALAVGGLYLFSFLPSRRFAGSYKLALIDKIALMTWVLAFTGAAVVQHAAIPIMSIGVMVLVTAWWLHRSKLHHRSHAIVQTADRS